MKRTIKELLELVLENIGMMRLGICSVVWDLYNDDVITLDEYNDLNDYIDDNRGSHYYRLERCYFWKPGLKRPRIAWLKKQIKLNTDINNK
jgi:hypothetical protein